MVIEVTTRRGFLAGLATTTLPRIGWAAAGSPAFLAAGKKGDHFVLHGLSSQGESVFDIALPARGHAACAHPLQPQAVAFARRPGIFAVVIDCVSGRILHQLTPPEGRQFNGHGTFSADGRVLLTSEVVAATSQGRIGRWDVTQGYARLGEWASGGIGPHDIKQLISGETLIANGGIATDPSDRTKLNIPTMQPNLTRLSHDGAVLDQMVLPAAMRMNSIRHLALLGGKVAFAMQWEGDPAEPVALLGLWAAGGVAQLCDPAAEDSFAMRGYAGSIAATRAGDKIAITSPKGGCVMIFDATGQPLATHRRADLSGVAMAGSGDFIVTDGQGIVWACDQDGLAPLARHSTLWDNHLIAVT